VPRRARHIPFLFPAHTIHPRTPEKTAGQQDFPDDGESAASRIPVGATLAAATDKLTSACGKLFHHGGKHLSRGFLLKTTPAVFKKNGVTFD
jgi:hypothetical protein